MSKQRKIPEKAPKEPQAPTLKVIEGGGQPHKITRDLKSAVIAAATRLGSDGKGKDGLVGYLTYLAKVYPKTFAGLLTKLMPLQVSSGNTGGNSIRSVTLVSVPSGQFLTAEEIKQLSPSSAPPDLELVANKITGVVDDDEVSSG